MINLDHFDRFILVPNVPKNCRKSGIIREEISHYHVDLCTVIVQYSHSRHYHT